MFDTFLVLSHDNIAEQEQAMENWFTLPRVF
jgi:glutaredoxin-related protein